MKREKLLFLLLGILIVTITHSMPLLMQYGLEAIGPVLGIILVIFSLFGELPHNLTWLTKLGKSLYPGVALGTILLLVPLLFPAAHHETSFFALSPTVWGAYISIVLVGISFESSTLPLKIYRLCKHSRFKPFILTPIYVSIAGLLGNVLDGVSIMIISTVILLHLLPQKWVFKSLFALLFGGLVSNLITVAAEPTNIKFQEVLAPFLNHLHPSFWITNWPISFLGILFPALFLSYLMHIEDARWKPEEPAKIVIFNRSFKDPIYIDTILATIAGGLLALGIVLHAILENIPRFSDVPLWILLLPAGIAALNHLFVGERLTEAVEHIQEQLPIWIKLTVIFSLLWFLQNGIMSNKNILSFFYLLPHTFQYILLTLLSLSSAVTDNVALAAMQATIILGHPLALWKIRLLLVLLTWAGGLTPFGCLQSLSMNHRLRLTTGQWMKETPVWAGLAILGGISGLLITTLLFH